MKIKRCHKQIIMFYRVFISLCLLTMNSVLVVEAQDSGKFLTEPLLDRVQTVGSSIPVLVDDFKPQPYQGDTIYFYNRIGGDRGALNNSIMDWGSGYVKATIAPGKNWGGLWESPDQARLCF